MREISSDYIDIILLAYQIGWRDGELHDKEYEHSINKEELEHRALTWLKMQIKEINDEESQGSIF
jgi:hypothetical protein